MKKAQIALRIKFRHPGWTGPFEKSCPMQAMLTSRTLTTIPTGNKSALVGIVKSAPGYNFHRDQELASSLRMPGNFESLSSFPSLNLLSLKREYSRSMKPIRAYIVM